jgi:hypothetical protein
MVEAGKTYTMRMGYGEEIVAKIISIDGDTYTLSKPVAVVPGQQGIQLMNSHCLPQILRQKSR